MYLCTAKYMLPMLDSVPNCHGENQKQASVVHSLRCGSWQRVGVVRTLERAARICMNGDMPLKSFGRSSRQSGEATMASRAEGSTIDEVEYLQLSLKLFMYSFIINLYIS